MLAVSPDLTPLFEALLAKQGIPVNQRSSFHKWLRYYLDFCQKYSLKPAERPNFSAFEEKLHAKNQSDSQRQQAKQAIAMYYNGIVGHPVDSLNNQVEARVQINSPIQHPHLNPTDATHSSQLSIKEGENNLPNHSLSPSTL